MLVKTKPVTAIARSGKWLAGRLVLSVAACAPDPDALGRRIYDLGRGTDGYLSYREGPAWMAAARTGCRACHGGA